MAAKGRASMRRVISVADVEGNEHTHQIAGLGSRAYAYAIDVLLKIFLVLLWFQICQAFWGTNPLLSLMEYLQNSELSFPMREVGPLLLVWFGYGILCECVSEGTSPGKRFVGIRLITFRGRAPSLYAIVLRNLFRLIDVLPGSYLIGMLVVFYSENQIRIGDLVAGTLAVHSDKSSQGYQHVLRTVTLDLEQHQYLRELLERWDNMKIDRRVQLAREFLKNIGKEAPEGIVDETIDRALYAQLKAISKNI